MHQGRRFEHAEFRLGESRARADAQLRPATRRACPCGVYPAISVARAREAMVCW